MKRLFLIGVVGVLISSGALAAKYETRVTESKFDGSITKSPTPALLTCNEWKGECPILSFMTISTQSDTVGITVGINSSVNYYNFSSLYFNIDGEIVEFKNLTPTTFDYKQAIRLKYSSAVFVAPLETLDKLKESKKIMVKVTTLSNGSFEAAMLNDGKESKAYKALKAFTP